VDLNNRATPVFTDDSGTRARIVQWVARALCAVVAMGVGALIVSLAMHVPLPGVGRNLALPGLPGSHGSIRDGASDNGGSSPVRVAAPDPIPGSGMTVQATSDMRSFRTPGSHRTADSPSPHPTGNATTRPPGRTPTRPPGRTPTTHPRPGTPNPHSAAHTPNPHSMAAHTPNPHSTAAKSRRVFRPHPPGSTPATHHRKKRG
jgi:hypothetical protein